MEEYAGQKHRRDYSLYHRLLDCLIYDMHIPADEFQLMLCVAQGLSKIGLIVEARDGHCQHAHDEQKGLQIMFNLLDQEWSEKNN